MKISLRILKEIFKSRKRTPVIKDRKHRRDRRRGVWLRRHTLLHILAHIHLGCGGRCDYQRGAGLHIELELLDRVGCGHITRAGIPLWGCGVVLVYEMC